MLFKSCIITTFNSNNKKTFTFHKMFNSINTCPLKHKLHIFLNLVVKQWTGLTELKTNWKPRKLNGLPHTKFWHSNPIRPRISYIVICCVSLSVSIYSVIWNCVHKHHHRLSIFVTKWPWPLTFKSHQTQNFICGTCGASLVKIYIKSIAEKLHTQRWTKTAVTVGN